jgi:hypothetical protein
MLFNNEETEVCELTEITNFSTQTILVNTSRNKMMLLRKVRLLRAAITSELHIPKAVAS